MTLVDKPVTAFLDELASDAPAPGGGSVAALSGALGAALISMVCNLTVGRKKYADVQDDVKTLRPCLHCSNSSAFSITPCRDCC